MGLMLSVLVFCVGVAEILDCWHHFLLHLVQPQYNPIPRHLDLKSDYLSDRELLNPLSDLRRTSNVDISWPKDLSPDDDLHVIKKRQHGESPRGNEHELDGHRVVRKTLHHEKEISTLPPASENVECPQTHEAENSFDSADPLSNPTTSRDTSPNRSELGVIIESDSSSDVDEPSQIENINYKKEIDYGSMEQEVELSNICHSGSLYASDLNRPTCPSAMILEEECVNELHQKMPDAENTLETSAGPELPKFTDNILSDDVMKVNVHYQNNSEELNVINQSHEEEGNIVNIAGLEEVKSTQLCPTEENAETCNSAKILPISTILDEGLEPIPEFPEIKVLESSPVPQEDDSDSSLNTSDASWMVRSKTSDRPLIIRFNTTSEKIQKDFESVVQTDLRALGENEPTHEEPPVRTLEKAESVEVYYDALVNQNGANNQEYANGINQLDNGERINNIDVKPLSVNVVQMDSNSSSSSLSGIPSLPEDTFESLTQSSLPTDNCFSQTTDMESLDLSYSHIDKSVSSLLTNTSEQNITKSLDQSESKPDRIELTLDTQLVNKVTDISDSYKMKTSNVEAIDLENNTNKESDNIPSSSNNLKEESFPQEHSNDKKHSVISTEKTEGHIDITPEDNTFVSNRIAQSPFSNEDIHVERTVPSPQDIVTVSKSVIDKESTTIEKCGNSEERITQIDPIEVLAKDVVKDVKEILSEKPHSPSYDSNDSKPSSSLLTDNNYKENIPTNLQERPESLDSQTGTLPKQASEKKKQKSSPKTLTDSDETGTIPQAVKSLEEIRNNEESASDVTSAPNELNISKPNQPTKSVPSDPCVEPGPSTSTSRGEEDKAFWLIFSGEYTKAMNKDWHSGHFCCWQCDESLTGQRYVLRDEHPYCVKCYESVFANGCEECSKIIGIDSKDLSYKDKHWHEACFLCNKCRVSLVDKQFGSKLDKIFCGNCYDQQFASRCDGCGNIFKAGTKKMEYKTRQWHEPCFACCVCKSPIGTKSFIPREQEIYCATCYEEKFATRCVKCNKIITSGGVTYKNEPWHRECFTCTNCNTSLAGQRFTSRDEKPYCADCFGELFAKRCTACSKPITGIGGTRFISFEDRHWHNDCFICASCKTSLVGRGFITDADDIICPECAKQKLM